MDLKMLTVTKHCMVWLVDDDLEDLELFQFALQKNGYEGGIRLVISGNLLMDLLVNSPRELLPSVIILDLYMNTTSGFEVLKDVKENPALRGLPVIILSGSANKEDEATCMALGCDRYWKKPDSIHEYDVMAKYLNRLF